MSQFADIRGLGAFLSQLVKELLYFSKVFQFYLFDEQDVNLYHHIHRLQQILRIVALFLEERVEAVVDVILEVAVRRHLGKNLLDDVLVVLKNLVQCVRAETVARLQIDELAEGETTQIVALDNTIEFRVLVFQAHCHAGCCCLQPNCILLRLLD